MDQSAYNNVPLDFYETVFEFIPEHSTVLNMGCGGNFNFEEVLYSKKKVTFICCDMLDLQKPEYVETYFKADLETEFTLEKKHDVVTFFEVIEHIDKTDILLKNCYRNLKDDGTFICSLPNLASYFGRLELLFGYQPHILEVSNEKANFGSGFIGRINNKEDVPLHHIRGLTYSAMKDMLQYHGFILHKAIGYDFRFKKLFNYIPFLAPQIFFICKKTK